MLHFLKIEPKGHIHQENTEGPQIAPWGTPQERGAKEEENLAKLNRQTPPCQIRLDPVKGYILYDHTFFKSVYQSGKCIKEYH